MNAPHQVEARACGHRIAEWVYPCPECWRAGQVDWVSVGYLESLADARRAGLPLYRTGSPTVYLAYPGDASADRGGAGDDEDAYAELRAARVRAALAFPPGLAGPREFAVQAGQLAGLWWHVMVRGGPPVEPVAHAVWHMMLRGCV